MITPLEDSGTNMPAAVTICRQHRTALAIPQDGATESESGRQDSALPWTGGQHREVPVRTATIIIVYLSLAVILGLIGTMLVHWRRFRGETDRYRAWQSVFGRRGAKVALTIGFVALATLTGALAAFQAQPYP